MHYELSFFDESGIAREICEADFESDGTAILWMRTVGAARSLRPNWSIMELRHEKRAIVRVPADVLRQAWVSQWHHWRDL